MKDFENLKKSLKKTLLNDFADIYYWFADNADRIHHLELNQDLPEDTMGYDCPPFTGVREMAEQVLKTGWIDEEAA